MTAATYSATAFSACPWEVMQAFKHDVWAVYLALHHYGWRSKEGCWASVNTISKLCGLGQRSVRNAIRQLRAGGWIVSEERPGGTTVHHVHLEPHVSTSQGAPKEPGQSSKPAATAEIVTQEPLSEMQGVSAEPLSEMPGVPLSKKTAPPLSKKTDEQDPLTTTSQQTTRTALIPPLPPHPGGHGLTAARGSTDGSADVCVTVTVEPAAEQPPAALAVNEQPAATAPIKARPSRRRRDSAQPTAEEARRLMTVWNDNKPAGWSSITCVNQRRWEVAMGWARDLGGLEAFFEALPVALANASQDRFWSGPGHDWNSFMGYGGDTGKGHFLRFLEQQEKREPTVNRDGSLTFLGSLIQTNQNPTPKFF